MNIFQFLITCKRTNNANNTTHYVMIDKKSRDSSKRNYNITAPRVIIKAIIIICCFVLLTQGLMKGEKFRNVAYMLWDLL